MIQGKLKPQAVYGAEVLTMDRRVAWEGLEGNSLKLLLDLPKNAMIQAIRRERRTVARRALADTRALRFYFSIKSEVPGLKLSVLTLPELLTTILIKRNPVMEMLRRLEVPDLCTE